MKKGKLFLASILISGSFLIGCSTGNTSADSINGNEQFIEVASDAINDRWDEQAKGEKKGYSTEQYINILETEVTKLEKAKTTIDDKTLLEKAENYIEGTKLQIEANKTQDSDLVYSYMQESEALRKPALISLVDDYGMVIEDQNQQNYNDFKTKAAVITKNNEAKEFAEKLATEIQFESSKDYDWTKYEAIVENTTDIHYDYISYNVQFKDSDGVTVDDGIISIDNFNPGEKKRVDVMTDSNHVSVNVTLNSFYLKE